MAFSTETGWLHGASVVSAGAVWGHGCLQIAAAAGRAGHDRPLLGLAPPPSGTEPPLTPSAPAPSTGGHWDWTATALASEPSFQVPGLVGWA